VLFGDHVEKCCRPRQATDDSIIRRMDFEWWITKATDTYQSMYYSLLFSGNNGYANAP